MEWAEEGVLVTEEIARPWFGRVLTVVMGMLALTALVATAVDRDAVDVVRLAPWMLLLAGGTWAAFGRPHVAVDAAGVRLVNVIRTVHVPWPAIRAVDTRWALTLVTAHGTFVAWAAPAPGMRAALRATREDTPNVPVAQLRGAGMRPGDLPSSPSGDAAAVVRRRWEELRAAGHLDDPRIEHERAPMMWHRGTIAAGVALVVLCALTLLV